LCHSSKTIKYEKEISALIRYQHIADMGRGQQPAAYTAQEPARDRYFIHSLFFVGLFHGQRLFKLCLEL
jgi:hypothetical protein